MSQTHLTLVGNGAGNTEALQSFADCRSRFTCLTTVLFDGNGSSDRVCPAGIFKTDRLYALYQVVNIQTGILGNLLRLFDGIDSVALQYAVDFINSSFI